MKNYLIFIFILFSCTKINYYPDNEIKIENPQKIVHRGGRSIVFEENTLEGIKYSLRNYDGVEVDVQISKDESIWLSHSSTVFECGTEIGCFPEMRNDIISKIKKCNSSQVAYTNLEDVFKFMKDSFPNKKIAIDLKGWFPCHVNSIDIEGMLRKEGEVIANLALKYGLSQNVLIETETSTILDFIKSKKTNVKLYLTSYGDLERAILLCLKQDYDGISFKVNLEEEVTKEKLELIHNKGLKLMVWNLNSQSEIPFYESILTDYIQFDL